MGHGPLGHPPPPPMNMQHVLASQPQWPRYPLLFLALASFLAVPKEVLTYQVVVEDADALFAPICTCTKTTKSSMSLYQS